MGEGPTKIFFYYQVQESVKISNFLFFFFKFITFFLNKKKKIQNDDMKDQGQNEPTLFITYGDKERLKDKAVFFFRNQAPGVPCKPIKLEDATDGDVICGEITCNTIPHLNHMMEYVYSPFIEGLKEQDWGQTEEEAQKEFTAHTDKFTGEVKKKKKLI